jgi:hypothetical protein
MGRPSRALTIAVALLLLLTATLWIGMVASAMTLHGSDAAGNGMSQAFAFLLAVAVWGLLCVLLATAALGGEMPAWAKGAALVLHPVWGLASLATLQVLSNGEGRETWLLVVPMLAPLLVMGYALWAFLPSLHRVIPSGVAGGVVWGGVLALSVLPWPAVYRSARVREQEAVQRRAEDAIQTAKQAEQERGEWAARFEKLPKGAPLWEWRDFTEHGEELRQRAFEGIRRLDRRQADAEELLDHGLAFPIQELPNLDLEITPSFCWKARAFLAGKLKALTPAVPGRPYSWEKASVDPYLPGMEWLLDHRCDCRAEVAAMQAGVQAYPPAADRDRALATLARLLRKG